MKQQLPINGATRLVGLMGWPISHSHSPAMHNAAFAALGLPWAYVPLPVQPGHAGDAVRGLAALGFAGANVTMPHKPAVMPHLDELTAAARTVGAVNTIIVREDGTLLGDTTDGYGFMADLAEHRVALDGPALVIGAGGAARSVTYALAEAGMTVAVCGLETDQAQHLCQVTMAALSLPAGRLTAHPYPAGLPELAPAAQLIVNATSLGMHEGDPAPWDPSVPFRPDQIIYDLVYHRPTAFLALAAADGARTIGGLGMLVHQGARSFELWTGRPAPVDVMAAATGS